MDEAAELTAAVEESGNLSKVWFPKGRIVLGREAGQLCVTSHVPASHNLSWSLMPVRPGLAHAAKTAGGATV